MTARFGGWILTTDPFAWESVGRAGYDFVVVDVQHGALDFSDAIRATQLLDAMGITPMLRISSTQMHEAPRYLDFGVGGIIVATIDDAEMASRAVSATRYQPDGIRSYGGARFGMAAEPADVAQVRPDVWPMIETAGGAASIDAIASVPGVTGLLVGPADLSRAYALPATHRSEDPRWNAAVESVVRIARQHGITSCYTARDGEDARRWAEVGYDCVVVGSDIAHLRAALGRELAVARGLSDTSIQIEV